MSEEKLKRVIASMKDPRERAIMIVLWQTFILPSEVKRIEVINDVSIIEPSTIYQGYQFKGEDM